MVTERAAQGEAKVPWLGNVPDRWGTISSKWLFRPSKELARPDDIQLSATQAYGVISQARYQEMIGRKITQLTKHQERRKHVEPDDFVISMRSFQGGLERAWERGAIRSSYVVLKPTERVHVPFFAHLFKSHDYIKALQATANFIRDGQDLNFDNFKMVDLPLVPLEEQQLLARYLDYVDRRIRRYIRAKQKLIRLLEEQKQVVIHRAVTRGLDPNVRLKPSGVEWLGEVPEHWNTPLNQRIFKEDIRPYAGGGEEPLSLSQRKGLIPYREMEERSLHTSSYDNWKIAIPGDLVVNRFKAHLGVFFASTLRGMVSFHYGVFAPRRELCTKYYELLYHTLPYKTIYAGRSNGMTVGLQNLSNQNFYNVRTLVPPVDEQLAIVAFCDQEARHVSRTQEKLQREIALLFEYRTRLVADVVTGKLDVREAAAQLPDEDPEIDDDTPLEPDESADLDEAIDEMEEVDA